MKDEHADILVYYVSSVIMAAVPYYALASLGHEINVAAVFFQATLAVGIIFSVFYIVVGIIFGLILNRTTGMALLAIKVTTAVCALAMISNLLTIMGEI